MRLYLSMIDRVDREIISPLPWMQQEREIERQREFQTQSSELLYIEASPPFVINFWDVWPTSEPLSAVSGTKICLHGRTALQQLSVCITALNPHYISFQYCRQGLGVVQMSPKLMTKGGTPPCPLLQFITLWLQNEKQLVFGCRVVVLSSVVQHTKLDCW